MASVVLLSISIFGVKKCVPDFLASIFQKKNKNKENNYKKQLSVK